MAMKIGYDPEVDVVYIKLSDAEILTTEETKEDVFVDLDREGHIVGLEFLNAKDFFPKGDPAISKRRVAPRLGDRSQGSANGAMAPADRVQRFS